MEGGERMRAGRPLLSVSGSLVLHGLAIVVAAFLVSRESAPPILLVELGEVIRVGEASAPPSASRGESRPARGSRGPRPAPGGARAPIAREPAAAPTPEPISIPTSEPAPALAPPAPAPSERPSPGAAVGGASDTSQAAGSTRTVGGAARDSGGAGIPGGGTLAMLVPSTGSAGMGSGGGDGGVPAEFGRYLARFRQRIQESLSYPLPARRRGLGGTVQLEVELLPSGKVASVVVRSSSTHAVLDEAALDTVRQLAPVPFPPEVPPRPLKVRLPIVFELK